jgi:hypothetical protein
LDLICAPPVRMDDIALWARFHSAWWLATEDIAISKFSSHLHSQLIGQDLDPPVGYQDEGAAWQFVEVLGKHFRRLLKDKLKKSPYFGISTDETTDNATNQHLILYIKFLHTTATGELVVLVEYLDLVSPASGGAEDITVLNYF